MSLYLCIFDGEDEISGWVLGGYKDFGCFREFVRKRIPDLPFPTLMDHSDCDGEWQLTEVPLLKRELETIAIRFKAMPAEEPVTGFKHTSQFRSNAQSLHDCFHNVDGENLIEALLRLCDEAISRRRPILFQ